MENGQIIKTTINGVPVELSIVSMGPASPELLAAVHDQIVTEGIEDAPLTQVVSTSIPNPKIFKEWYMSKTLWFNALALLTAVAAHFGYNGEIPPELEQIVPVGMALVNIFLRLVTKEPVAGTQTQ